MSRLAQRNGATQTLQDDELSEDICPVCKSSRYLNPNMKFLVNPECYHKMCESCVDRIFSHGPAACPIAGCRKTLRKHRFRKQTFGDIQVEREVDIRRRVAEVFNRREDEFDSLKSYNNYLEEVENITFNLINNIDMSETERKLARYKDENLQSIKQNARLASDETASVHARQAAEKERARLRREASLREEEDEKRERQENRRQVLDKLASGEGNAEQIAKEGERVMLKRSSARKNDADMQYQKSANESSPAAAGEANDTFVIRGLRKRVAPVPETNYDAFGGIEVHPQYYTVQKQYHWDWLDEAQNNPLYTAGGYNVREYYQRALCDAFSGLGVFVGAESVTSEVATKASVLSGNLLGDDVF